ncbi:MAG TPA: DUF6785 family protein [Chthonomonadaceae bacterium]|nr:DUF6785 family protein [Chthonomonadaceae bacterium]
MIHPQSQERERPVPERAREERINALSPRALMVGLVCVVITCFVVCYAELVVGKIQIGFLQLPPVVIGMLVLILGVQAVLTRFSARLRLRPHEMFTIYVMMLLASMVSSRGLLQKLIPLLIVPDYYATPENGWKSKFFAFIPRWVVPFDPNGDPKQFVAARFYEALRPGEHIPWQLWIVPLCCWAVFVALVFTAMLCLAVLLRRQWVDNEKLAFPLVQLPLEMVRGETPGVGGAPGGSFLKNPLTWIGFALPALLFGFNGLHQWYPSIPDIQTDIDLNAYFNQPPWNDMTYFHMFLSFAAVGFFYLLPTDLLFSLWFFFLLTKYEEVQATALGYQTEVMPMYGCKTFIGYQIIGCYIVLVGYMVWSARPHLARVARAALRLRARSGDEDADEVLSYPFAFWGLIVSLLLAAGWMTLLGTAYWLALFELGVMLFVVALVMARSTCESGMLMTETSFRPIDIYRMVGDVRQLGGANLTGMAFLDGLWLRDQRGLLLTGFLDSMKFADGVRVRRRSLLGVFVIALLVAVGVSGYLHISLPYRLGAVQMYSYVYQGNPVMAFDNAASTLNGAQPPLPFFATLNFFIGALVTVLLATLRTRLLWFPFHPLGYALSGCWTMMVFWFPCFVAWLCKVFLLRYGGMQLYAKARPFFLGMVLGEFTTAVLFTLPALYNRFTPTPFFPWP